MDAGLYIPLDLARGDHGKATSYFAVGDSCNILGSVIVREGEDLESAQLKKLPQGCRVEILEIGGGPTGKRVRIVDETGQEGWVSVVAENGDRKLDLVLGQGLNLGQGALCDGAEASLVAAVEGGQAQPAARGDKGMPTEAFQVGDEYEVLQGIQMRQAEDLSSPPLRALPNKTRVKVVGIGTGPTGRRICVSDERGREGWVSVAAANGEALLRPVEKRKPEVLNKRAALVPASPAKAGSRALAIRSEGAAPVAAESTDVVIQWQERARAMDILGERMRMEGVARLGDAALSVLAAGGHTLQAPDGRGVWVDREAFPLTLRCQPAHPGALQLVLDALKPPAPEAGLQQRLLERLSEAVAEGSVAEARRAAQAHIRALAAEASRGTARGRLPPPAPAPPGWRCPPGCQPLEHMGTLYLLRQLDGLIFKPGEMEVPVGVWSGQRQRVEPAMGRTSDSPHTQLTYFGKTYVLLHGNKLFDPDTQHVVALLNRETLQIERIDPIPIAVSSFLEQKGFGLQSLTSGGGGAMESTPFIQVLRGAPVEALEDREEALQVVSEGSWKALRFASPQLRGDRELVLKAVRGERGLQSWKMLLYAAQQFQRDPEVLLEAVRRDVDALELAEPNLLGNRDFMLDAVREQGLALRYADEELRADRELACAAVGQTWQALRHVAEELLDDEELADAAVRQSWRALELLGEAPRGDRALVELAVGQSWAALQFAAAALRADRALVSAALEQSHDALHFAAPELLADRGFMLGAVRAHGLALGHAAEELRADRELVREAVRHSPRALRYASAELRADREVVLEAVQRDPEAVKYAAGPLPGDREVLMACLGQDAGALERLPEGLRADRAFMLRAVELRGMALRLASAELRGDAEVVLAAARQSWRALRYAAEELLADPGFMRRAVQAEGLSLAFADERLRANAELVLEAARQDHELLEYAAAQLLADRDFALQAVRLNGLALRFLAPALRADRGVVLEAVAMCGQALEHAGQELRGDCEVAMAAVRQDPQALGCASDELRCDAGIVLEAVRRDGLVLRLAGGALRADTAVVLAALRQNWRALRHAAPALRSDRGFMRDAVRVNGLTLSLATGEAREDAELLLESTKDPTSRLGSSAFAWPTGLTLAKLPPPTLAHGGSSSSGGHSLRASGLPLTAFASIAPDLAGLGPEALLSVAMREMGAWGDNSTHCPAGVLDAALDTLQPHTSSSQHAGDPTAQRVGFSQGIPSETAATAGGSLGRAVGSEPTLSATSAASECSTACSKVDEARPDVAPSSKAGAFVAPRPRRAPNARVAFQ